MRKVPEIPELKELRQKMMDADDAVDVAKERAQAAEDAYVAGLAEALGVRIGSIVIVQDALLSRYMVTCIGFSGIRTPPLQLRGRLIRADGTPGIEREIWREWKLESTAKGEGS